MKLWGANVFCTEFLRPKIVQQAWQWQDLPSTQKKMFCWNNKNLVKTTKTFVVLTKFLLVLWCVFFCVIQMYNVKFGISAMIFFFNYADNRHTQTNLLKMLFSDSWNHKTCKSIKIAFSKIWPQKLSLPYMDKRK